MQNVKKFLNKIIFYCFWFSSKLFGVVPTFLQYLFSDFIFLILRYLIRYRIKVVRENLKNSFPSYSDEKISKIEKGYYRHLADLFVETLLLSSLSANEMKKRMVFENPELINSFCQQFGSVLVTSAHYASWEYTITFALYTDENVYAVFHPLSSEIMDRYYFDARSRFGTIPIPMDKIVRQMVTNKKSNTKELIALIADQTPPGIGIKRWIHFLNQPTAFFNGAEALALKFKIPVLYLDVRKVKRGYYRATANVIYDGEESIKTNDITKRYAKKLEQIVNEEPQYWLWSHRRWKHLPSKDDVVI